MDKLLHAGSTRGFQQRRHHLRIEVEITVVNPYGTHHDVDASTAQSASYSFSGCPRVAERRVSAKKARADQFKRQLYDVNYDIGEVTDVSAKNPEVVKELETLLNRYRDGGYSRELPPADAK